MAKTYEPCPECGKKGLYEVRGYDPQPDHPHRLYACRYCSHSERRKDPWQDD